MSKGRDRTKPDFQRSLSSPFPNGANNSASQKRSESFKSEASGVRQQAIPPWDRTFDAVYHKNAQGGNAGKVDTTFRDTLARFFEDHGRKKFRKGYFALPDNVRLRICQFLLAPQRQKKPLRLNLASFDQNCWRSEDLQSPRTALRPLRPYLEVSFSFRADILVTFLLDVPLHATFSPYVGPRLNPLATTWLNKYGVYAQNIAIELDMTRLRCGPSSHAVGLLPGVDHIETLLREFVGSQLRRDASRPLSSLILLCRRFHGQRDQAPSVKSIAGRSSEASNYSQLGQRSESASAASGQVVFSHTLQRAQTSSPVHLSKCYSLPEEPGDDSVQECEDGVDTAFQREAGDKTPTSPYFLLHRADYCPDSYLVMCSHLLRLRDRVDSVRMCGFSEPYTHRFIQTFFQPNQASIERQAYRVAPSTIWPRLGGQKAYVDFGDGCVTLDDHDASVPAYATTELTPWEGCVQLPPPVLDADGNASLPSAVASLLTLRGRTWRSGAEIAGRGERGKAGGDLVEVGVDKKRIMKMFSTYGKAKGKKKQALTKDQATIA